MSQITGGSPAGRKIVEVSDWEMKEIERLRSAGPSVSYDSIKSCQRAYDKKTGRISKAQKYEEFINEVKAAIYEGGPRVQEALRKANAEIVSLKDIDAGTVHQNSTLSNLSIQYANEEFIGLELAPIIQTAKETDTYYTYGQRDRVAYPDDALGNRDRATEFQETRGTATYTCLPYGYSNFVAQRTLNNQDAPLDELVDVVESINEGLLFREESRIATLMTTGGNYGGNTTAIGAANRWDTATGGDPIADIQDTMLAALWTGRGPGELKFFSPLEVYNVLSRHPAILDLFKYNGSSPGLATPNMIAGFFGVQSYLIGKARQDTANEGQTAVYTRLWGADSFGVARVMRRPSRRNAAFASTFRHGTKLTSLVYEQLRGHGGGYTAQVSLSETSNVIASPTGYLLTTVRA